MKRVSSPDNLEYHRNELANLQRELNEQREAENSQMLQSSTRNRKPVEKKLYTTSHYSKVYVPSKSEQPQKYDGEGLPPPPRSKKSSSSKQKQIQEIIPPRINTINLPRALSQSAQTFASLNPQAKRRTTKFTKKSKGGKNKTKKRKAKKNKKTKK
jgi:hypothetical protein